MNIDELERTAARGEPLPENLLAPESLLYLSLRQLYWSWKSENLTKESAKAEKGRILSTYSHYREMYESTKRLCDQFVNGTKSTEYDRRMYHLAEQKGAYDDELLKIAKRIIRTSTGDTTF